MVTFRTNSYRDVSMFTSDAHTMLRLMGLSTTVPSALKAEEVPAALERLKQGVAQREAELSESGDQDHDKDEDEDDEENQAIPLGTRAFPLIELLGTAAENNEYVIWN